MDALRVSDRLPRAGVSGTPLPYSLSTLQIAQRNSAVTRKMPPADASEQTTKVEPSCAMKATLPPASQGVALHCRMMSPLSGSFSVVSLTALAIHSVADGR